MRVSPTQFQLFLLCRRKWAFAYIQGLREPITRQLAFGLAVHALLEAYLRHGAVPDLDSTWTFALYLERELGCGDDKRADAAQAAVDAGGMSDTATRYPGKVALSMMPAGVFPAPGVGLVEDRFEFEDRGVVWNGLLDWHTFNPIDFVAPEFEGMPGAAESGLVIVIDHKTSSDPAKWGKLGDDDDSDPARALADDIQAVVYSRAMLDRYGPANIEAHWNYGHSGAVASAARVATTRMVPGEVYAKFENDIAPIGQEIRKLRLANPDPLSLPPSPDACFAYHKLCPHAGTCNLSTKERLDNIMGGNALIDNLLKQAGAAPATPAAPTTPPPAPGDAVNPPEAAKAPTPPVAPTPPTAPTAAPATRAAPTAAAKPTPPKPKPAAPAPTAPAALPPAALTGDRLQDMANKIAFIRSIDPKLADHVAERIAEHVADEILNRR